MKPRHLLVPAAMLLTLGLTYLVQRAYGFQFGTKEAGDIWCFGAFVTLAAGAFSATLAFDPFSQP